MEVFVIAVDQATAISLVNSDHATDTLELAINKYKALAAFRAKYLDTLPENIYKVTITAERVKEGV